jgi:hypothetical protein
MAKVDGVISSLLQGVSQQPARERLKGQCELQINCSSDTVRGLTRRNPTEFIKTLLTTEDTYSFFMYKGDSLGEYLVAYKAGDVRVFGLDGTEYTVTEIDDALDYVPDAGIRFEGIEEDIYLVNPTKVITASPDVPEYVEDAAIVFLLGGQYGRAYTIVVEWGTTTVTATYTTPDGSSSSHILNVATDFIADKLLNDGTNGLSANTDFTTNFDYVLKDDVIYMRPKSGAGITNYTVTISDGDGGSNMFMCKDVIRDVGKLPLYASQGFVVEVQESLSASEDNWYLQYVINDDSIALGDGFGVEGLWVETSAPDLEYKLDASTMPHVLRKVSPTAFELTAGEWEDRRVGDDTTNPMPSFVNATLNDISSFQGRLALTSGTNLILSRTFKPTDFFMQSATTLADDDPIDIASSLGKFNLYDIVPHNRDLVLFSDGAQFILFGRNTLTPRNSSLVLTTEFEADLSAEPVGAGRNVFFTYKYGGYVGVQEFFTDGSDDINDAQPITSHVSKLIEGAARSMASTTNFNTLLVSSTADTKKLYSYEYLWQNKQKVQSSWGYWEFFYEVVYFTFVDNLVYMVFKTDTGYDFAYMNLDDTETVGVGYKVMLDHRFTHTDTTTTITVPYPIEDIAKFRVVQGAGCPNAGMLAEIQSYTSDTITLKASMNGGTVHVGRKYLSRFIPTMPFVRDQDGTKVGSGKLTIKDFTVYFTDTGAVTANSTDSYGYTATVTYNGRVLGDPNNLIGEPVVIEGSFQIPHKLNADTSQLELYSDSHLPFSLTEIEWRGQYKKKGQRITGG